MEYERIDKPQTGILSPSKLRAKLLGVSHQKKKDGSNSNSNSSRTSPSRLEDSEFAKNSLLASNTEDFDESTPSLEPPSTKSCGQIVSSSAENQIHCLPRENVNGSHVKIQKSSRGDGGNSSAVHPLKPNEDDNLDYDSNTSSSSFEFHNVVHRSLIRSLSRSTSYKWNDAEKWIMNKQVGRNNFSNNHGAQSRGNHMLGVNMVRVAPQGATHDYRLPPRGPDPKRVDFSEPFPIQSNGKNVPVDLYHPGKDPKEAGNVKNSTHDVSGNPGIRAISMRDMGTEMTPVPSQEPSRTATPVGPTTPLRSPTSSSPSTPGRGRGRREPATTSPMERTAEKSDKELSEQELKLKTRREIVALGVQLGKMNIAAWASRDDKGKPLSPIEITDPRELERVVEFEKRAAAWEVAEKSKHAARYKREEIKIQAWESQQKAKLEEELRRLETKVERVRTQSQEKMVKKIAIAKKRSEEKRAAIETRKRRHVEKTRGQAEYIRQTGEILPSDYVCCGFF